MLLRDLLAGGRSGVEDGFQRPEVFVPHDALEAFFGSEEGRGHAAQNHLAVLPVSDTAGMGTSVVRVNTEDLPFSGVIDYSIGIAKPASIFSDGSGTENWFGAVWYRRLRVPTKPVEMDAGVYDFCVRENRSALIGGLIGHETRWMSHPGAI